MRWTWLVGAWLSLAVAAAGEDWPQWRGPRRDGVSREALRLDQWPADGGPPIAWRAQVGAGHSAVSVAGGRAYTLGMAADQDTVYCLDAATGRVVWQRSYPARTIVQWPGPRSTPTVDGPAVFTLGQWGYLAAWDTASGRPLWNVQLPERVIPDPDYGCAWSPLVEGQLLILGAGRRGLGLDKRTGQAAWGDDTGRGACASPVPFVWEGRRGVAVVTCSDDRESVQVSGVDPLTGAVWWSSPAWREHWGAACVDPIVDKGRVFLTTAEQFRQCARYTIEGATMKEDWSHNRLAGYTGSCVLLGGALYAVDARGILKCLDWETGEVRWAERGFDERGTLIAAGDQLLVQTGASGELAVVAVDPARFRELRRMKVFEGEPATFTSPVFAEGRVYCRSYAGEVVCVDVWGAAP